MNIPELLTRAEFGVETVVAGLVGIAVSACVSIIGFFVARSFKTADGTRDEVRDLREELGILKGVNKAQWRNIEEMKSEIKAMRDRLDRINENRSR